MRLAVESAVLETNVVGDSQVFQINATGAAFRTLIDGLYSNKEQSIVRELAANAWDSQKRAGTSKPFYIQSPTTIDPTFGVRDFGIGMTHTKVMSLYTTMFMSDKSDSNEQVGMFGLGSKSPFAYTDQFNLSCYDGKIVRHYSCAIGAGSVPQINVIAQADCDEPRGVHVSFAVKSGDFQKFQDAIAQVSLGHEPCFETNQKNLPSRGKVAIEGKGWRSYTNSHIPSQWVVRQGCVIYPLTETGGLRLPSDASGRHYLIECPIGTIQVTASRESVSYKPEVIEYLRDRIEHIKSEAIRYVKEQTTNIDNVFMYFSRIKEIKPNFADAIFTHPLTGLQAVEYQLPMNAVEVEAHRWQQNPALWAYNAGDKLLARMPNAKSETVVIVSNYEHVLETDVQRETGAFFFTPKERRKICMRVRGYASEVLHEGGVRAWFGFELDQNMLDHFYPNVNIVRVNYKDMPTGLKGRSRGSNDDREETPIRGVYLAPTTGGKVKPTLLADITDDKKTAWVAAEFYRRDPAHVRDLTQKLGIERLFTSTIKSAPRLVERGIPSVEQFVSRFLPWADFVHASEQFTGYDDAQSSVLHLARALKEHKPDLYASTLRSKSILGLLLRRFEPLIPFTVIPLGNWHLRSTVDMLNEDDKRKARKDPVTLEFAEATHWVRMLESKGTPFALVLKGTARHNEIAPESVEEITLALIALAKLTPPEKYLT